MNPNAHFTADKGPSGILSITRGRHGGVRFWSVLRGRWEEGTPSKHDLATMSSAQRAAVAILLLERGAEVEAGRPGTQEWDRGSIMAFEAGGQVDVAWQGAAQRISVPAASLRPYGGEDCWFVADDTDDA